MKGLTRSILAGGAVFLAASSAVLAQYRPPASKGKVSSQDESFEDSVDLKRFRRGNYEWDTQEFIRSGFTALHREHQQILRELEELRRKVERLEAARS